MQNRIFWRIMPGCILAIGDRKKPNNLEVAHAQKQNRLGDVDEILQGDR